MNSLSTIIQALQSAERGLSPSQITILGVAARDIKKGDLVTSDDFILQL